MITIFRAHTERRFEVTSRHPVFFDNHLLRYVHGSVFKTISRRIFSRFGYSWAIWEIVGLDKENESALGSCQLRIKAPLWSFSAWLGGKRSIEYNIWMRVLGLDAGTLPRRWWQPTWDISLFLSREITVSEVLALSERKQSPYLEYGAPGFHNHDLIWI